MITICSLSPIISPLPTNNFITTKENTNSGIEGPKINEVGGRGQNSKCKQKYTEVTSNVNKTLKIRACA